MITEANMIVENFAEANMITEGLTKFQTGHPPSLLEHAFKDVL